MRDLYKIKILYILWVFFFNAALQAFSGLAGKRLLRHCRGLKSPG
ncbi:hypothetical protein [Polaromonas sp.]